MPGAPQRLGAPRGYFELTFNGSEYVDTFKSFSHAPEEQMHASFSTPRYRDWAQTLVNWVDAYGASRADILPPVSLNDLGDVNMITRADLAGGTWLAVNVWNGAQDTIVTAAINDGEEFTLTRTQAGEGEAKLRSIEASDPYAMIRQPSDTARAMQSATGKDGYEVFQGGRQQAMVPGPMDSWLWANSSIHLWTADLPADLPAGIHALTVTALDHHGREYTHTMAFEVVETIPDMGWQEAFWE